MSIVPDGGLWNENISELQAALNDLGASPPLDVNGVISNTTIHALQVAVNSLGADPPLAEDGGLGNDAIRELQIAVAALQGGGVTPVDPGPPIGQFLMRELGDSTLAAPVDTEFNVFVAGGAVSLGGSFDVALGWPINDSFTVTTGDEEADVRAAIDAICDGAVVTTIVGTGGIGGAGLLTVHVVLAGDGAGNNVSVTVENDTILPGPPDNAGAAVVVVRGGSRLLEWAAVTGDIGPIRPGNYGFNYSGDTYAPLVSSDADGTVVSGVEDDYTMAFLDLDFTEFDDGWTIVQHAVITGTFSSGIPAGLYTNNLALYIDVADDEPIFNDFLVRGQSPEENQYGGPILDEAYLWTCVWDAETGRLVSHIDGPELDVQTKDWIGVSDPGGNVGLALFNGYYGVGYTPDMDMVEVDVFNKPLSEAERLFVRQSIRDANAGLRTQFVLRDEVPPEGPTSVSGTVVGDDDEPIEGVVVAVIHPADQTILATAPTDEAGEYLLTVQPFAYGEGQVVARAPSNLYCDTWWTELLYGNPVAVLSRDNIPFSGDPVSGVNIKLITSLDPTEEAAYNDDWDMRDVGSLTIVDDEVTAIANQIALRPAFEIASGSMASGALILGANAVTTNDAEAHAVAEGIDLAEQFTVIVVGECSPINNRNVYLMTAGGLPIVGIVSGGPGAYTRFACAIQTWGGDITGNPAEVRLLNADATVPVVAAITVFDLGDGATPTLGLTAGFVDADALGDTDGSALDDLRLNLNEAAKVQRIITLDDNVGHTELVRLCSFLLPRGT